MVEKCYGSIREFRKFGGTTDTFMIEISEDPNYNPRNLTTPTASAWSIYKAFETKDDPVFIGIVSEKHWKGFCEVFGRDDWANDERLATNNKRISERDWLLPAVEEMIKQYTRDEILQRCEAVDITVAPIGRPEDLFDDPQLNKEKGGLLQTVLPSGVKTKLPRMPIEMGEYDFGLRSNPPQLGSDTREVLRGLGYGDEEISRLIEEKVVVAEE